MCVDFIIFSSEKNNRLNELSLFIDLDFIGFGLSGWRDWDLKGKNFRIGLTILFFSLIFISYNSEDYDESEN